MQQLEHLLSTSGRVSMAVAVLAVVTLGGIAVAATSKVPLLDSVASAPQPARQADRVAPNLETDYFPAQFAAPEGEPAEPIATF